MLLEKHGTCNVITPHNNLCLYADDSNFKISATTLEVVELRCLKETGEYWKI